MRILLLGARGQLGRALFSALSAKWPHWQLVALGRDECDIADSLSLVGALRRHRPDVIINAAAYTAVDRAESEPDIAEITNHWAVMELARGAQAIGALLVHFSTDYVFDGTGTKPWVEADKPCPLNVYGASKYAGEQAIQRLCPNHLIFRTSWLYGGVGTHFANTILARAGAGQDMSVVVDQWGAPTPVEWLASAVVLALAQALKEPDKRGLYHLSCQGETSWHGFASALVEEALRLGQLVQTVTVHPIGSDEWPQQARRPLNSRLDCQLFSTAFKISLPQWHDEMKGWLANRAANISS